MSRTTQPTLHLTTSQRKTESTAPASPIIASPFKRKTMSITQTYFLAHKARAKLSSEAARPDHNLRLLVGHANLLDSLMLELADAEREQESWFNQSVMGANKSSSSERHIQWADAVVEEPEEDWQADDADSDSSSDSDSEFDEDEDVEMADVVSLRRVPSHKMAPLQRDTSFQEVEVYDDDDEEDYAELTLTRSPSHSASPPELDHDSDSSEDESMPPSPPQPILASFSEKQEKEMTSGDFYDTRQDTKEPFYEQGFYLPPRNPARLVSAISVY